MYYIRKFLGLEQSHIPQDARPDMYSDAVHIEKPNSSRPVDYVCSARGNELQVKMKDGYLLRGVYQIEERDTFIVLAINPEGKGEIGSLNLNTDKYCTLINEEDLDCPLYLSSCTWVPMYGQVLTKCNQVKVYFVTNNISRAINVDDPCKDYSDTKLMKARCVGKAIVTPVKGMGRLLNGTYQVTIQASDSKGAFTNYAEFTYPVCVADKQCRPGQESDFGLLIKADLPNDYNQVSIVIRECVTLENQTALGSVRTKVIDWSYGGGQLSYTYTGSEGEYRDNVIDSVKSRVPKVFEGGELFSHEGKLGIYNEVPRRTYNIQKYVSKWRVGYQRFLIPVKDAKNFPTLRSNENYPLSIKLNFDDGTQSAFNYELINDNFENEFLNELPTDHERNCTNCPQPFFRFYDTSRRQKTFIDFEGNKAVSVEDSCPECEKIESIFIDINKCENDRIKVAAQFPGEIIFSEEVSGYIKEGSDVVDLKVEIQPHYCFDILLKAENGCMYSGYVELNELCEEVYEVKLKRATKYIDEGPDGNDDKYKGDPGSVNIDKSEKGSYSSGDGIKVSKRCGSCGGTCQGGTCSQNTQQGQTVFNGSATIQAISLEDIGNDPSGECITKTFEGCGDPLTIKTKKPLPDNLLDSALDTTCPATKAEQLTCGTCTREDATYIIGGSMYTCKGGSLYLRTDQVPIKSAPEVEISRDKIEYDMKPEDYKVLSHELRGLLADECIDNTKPIPYSKGKFGYWETEEVYPDVKVCTPNGEIVKYWGELTGKGRRLFRTPSITKEPIYIAFRKGVPYRLDPANDPCDDAYMIVTAPCIDGITLPKSVKDRLCKKNPVSLHMGYRGEQDKSVRSTGTLINLFAGDIQGEEHLWAKLGLNSLEFYDHAINPGGNNTLRKGRATEVPAAIYHSADFHLWGNKQDGDYMFIEQEESGCGRRLGDYAEGEDVKGWFANKCNNAGRRSHISLTNYKVPLGSEDRQPLVRCVKAITTAAADSIVGKGDEFSRTLVNKCRETSQYIEFTEQLPQFNEDISPNVQYGSTDGVRDVRSDLSFIGDHYDHEALIPEVKALTGTLMKYLPNQYGSVIQTNYIPMGITGTKDTLECCSLVGIGGDSFVGPFSVKRTFCVSDKSLEDISNEGNPYVENPFSPIDLNALIDPIKEQLLDIEPPDINLGSVGNDDEIGDDCLAVIESIEASQGVTFSEGDRATLCSGNEGDCAAILNAQTNMTPAQVDAACASLGDAAGGGGVFSFVGNAIKSAFNFLVNALISIVEFFVNALIQIFVWILRGLFLIMFLILCNIAIPLVEQIINGLLIPILHDIYNCYLDLVRKAECGQVPVSGTGHVRHEMSLRGDMRAVQNSGDAIANPTDGDCPDSFGPHLLKTLIKTFTISDANLNLRGAGDIRFGDYKKNDFGKAEVFAEKLGPFELDSESGAPPEESFMTRFFGKMEEVSKADNLFRNILRVGLSCGIFFALLYFGIQSIIGGLQVLGGGGLGTQTFGGIMSIIFGILLITMGRIWLNYVQGDGRSLIFRQIDKFLSIKWCFADIGFAEGPGCRFGMDLKKHVKQFEDNYFYYNIDFSKLPTEEMSFGVPTKPDFSYCPNEKSGIIRVSQEQDPESHIDAWSRFNTVEKVVIPRDRGKLMKVISMGGVVIAHTDTTMFRIAGATQTINFREDALYLGNANIFGKPQDLYGYAPSGYGGLQDPNAAYLTSRGYFFPSGDQGKWFQYNGSSTKDLPFRGLEEFFDCNMRMVLQEHFPEYKNRDQKNYGIGYDFSIDQHKDIIYLYKRDYEPLSSKIEYKDGCFVLDGKEISLHGPNFRDRSFMVSYNLRTGQYNTRHRWRPQMFLWDNHHMYSIDKKGIWNHDVKYVFANWYGKEEAVYVEIPISLKNSKIAKSWKLKNIVLVGNVYEYKDGIRKNSDLPLIDKFMVINSSQASNWIPLRRDGVITGKKSKKPKRNMIQDVSNTNESRWKEAGNCIQLLDFSDTLSGECPLEKWNNELGILEPKDIKGPSKADFSDDFVILRLYSKKPKNVEICLRKIYIGTEAEEIDLFEE